MVSLGSNRLHYATKFPVVVAVAAQLSGKLGALRRWGQPRTATAVQRPRDHLLYTVGLVRGVIYQNAERFQGHISSTKY